MNDSGNRPSRKELSALLGTAIPLAYSGAVVSAFLAAEFAMQNHLFEVFWWIGGVCWFLAPVLSAGFGYLLAKRLGWNVVTVVTLAVLPWLVTTAVAILLVAGVS